MYAYDIPTQAHQITWVIVADSEKMRIYESHVIHKIMPEGTPRHFAQSDTTDWDLRHILDLDLTSESMSEYKTKKEDRGAAVSSISSFRQAGEPRVDIRDEIKDHFAQAIIARLAKGHQDKKFSHLILVAPQRMLGKIRDAMDASLVKTILKEIPKELTHLPNAELLAHLKSVLTVPVA